MKRPQIAWACIISILGLIFILHAQETATSVQMGTQTLEATPVQAASDLDVMVQAVESTAPMPASAVPPDACNFYSTQHLPGTENEWPPLPGDVLKLPFWPLGGGFYLLDDRNVNYAAIQAKAEAEGLMSPMGLSFTPQVFTTNQLWLSITGKTNTTAYLVIHPPWNVTNGVWGLYFKTNLAVTSNWTWLLQNAPGQTNLVASNLPPAPGFFMLGLPMAIRPGFTNNILDRNDDGSTDLVPVGFFINFFGTSYSNLYVNNNGNVTFDNPLSTYIPSPLVNFRMDIIAPFWADVDTSNTNSGVTTYGSNTADGRAAFGVSWIDVGYFYAEDDKLNSFQMVMIDRSDRTNGDFDLEFNYSQIQWDTGDFSGGCDGLWVGEEPFSPCDPGIFGSPARAGYASASGSTFELNGSGIPGAFLDTNTVTGLIYTNFNSTVPGRYVFQFHNGVPLGTP